MLTYNDSCVGRMADSVEACGAEQAISGLDPSETFVKQSVLCLGPNSRWEARRIRRHYVRHESTQNVLRGVITVKYLFRQDMFGQRMIFQRIPNGCSCCRHLAGCMCGDCSRCTNSVADGILVRNVKRYTIVGICLLLAVGFVVLVPVVPLGTGVPVTEGVSVAVEANSAPPMGSIAFCYLGQGAAVFQGMYYIMTRPAAQVDVGSCPSLQSSP